jgi:hypothetical protein
MAKLTVSRVRKVPLGDFWLVTGRVTTTADSVIEWIQGTDIGISRIISANLQALDLAPQTTPGVGCTLNAQGTGVAEDVNLGDLGVRTDKIQTLEFWIIGTGASGTTARKP